MTHFSILLTPTHKNGKLYELYNYNNGEVFARVSVSNGEVHEEILSDFINDLSGCLFEIISEFSHTTKSIPHEYDGDHKHRYESIRGWKARKNRETKLNLLGV